MAILISRKSEISINFRKKFKLKTYFDMYLRKIINELEMFIQNIRI